MSNDMSNVMLIIMVNVTSKVMSNVAQKVNRQQMDKEHTGESHRVHEHKCNLPVILLGLSKESLLNTQINF